MIYSIEVQSFRTCRTCWAVFFTGFINKLQWWVKPKKTYLYVPNTIQSESSEFRTLRETYSCVCLWRTKMWSKGSQVFIFKSLKLLKPSLIFKYRWQFQLQKVMDSPAMVAALAYFSWVEEGCQCWVKPLRCRLTEMAFPMKKLCLMGFYWQTQNRKQLTTKLPWLMTLEFTNRIKTQRISRS